ncbi:PMS1 protein homolog 1 isoform X2 [Nematostella vectensis]|nr:PMS1 protein homolog 1 isoform X2 [Nematostella vectensis]
MAQRHYTSKITTFHNLDSLASYGFRGEALCSLCAVSNVSVMTKTNNEEVGMCYTLDQHGRISATKPLPLTTGTAVTACNLFKNLPVRKQFSRGNKKCKDELKKVEELIMAFGLIHPSVRLTLRHNKSIIWQKNKCEDLKKALTGIIGANAMSSMEEIMAKDDQTGLRIEGFVPKPGSDPNVTSRSMGDRSFVYVNKRPVVLKEIAQVVREFYLKIHPTISNRHPVAFLSIEVPPCAVDVNLEPNKSRVLLTEKDIIIDLLRNSLEELYVDHNKEEYDQENLLVANGGHSIENGKTNNIIEKVSKTRTDVIAQHTGKSLHDNHSNLDNNLSSSNLDNKCTNNGMEAKPPGNTSKDSKSLFKVSGGDHQSAECSTASNVSSVKQGESIDKLDIDNIARLLDDPTKDCLDIRVLESPLQQDKRSSDVPNFELFDPDELLGDDDEFDEILATASQQRTLNRHVVTPGTSNLSSNSSANDISSNSLSVKDVSTEDWSRGGMKNDHGQYVQPSILVTPSTIQDKNKTCTQKKRKLSNEKARLTEVSSKKIRTVPKVCNQPLITMHVTPSSNQKKHAARTVTVQFSMKILRNSLGKRHSNSKSEHSHGGCLIGRLHPSGIWLRREGSAITFIHQYRIQEQLLFTKLLQHHSFPKKQLDTPIILDNRLLKDESKDVLMNLKCSKDVLGTSLHVNDSHIVDNGFDVRKRIGTDGEVTFTVHGITTSVPYYGVPDLMEILDLLREQGSVECSLSKTRPLKALNYLKGEAVRLARGISSHMTRDDLQSILDQMSCDLPDGMGTCLHQRPFFGNVANIAVLQ